jgi:hypothetical protein
MEPVERANELAAALARRGVDPSEVAGVFRHLRAFLDQATIDGSTPDQGVEYWWRWLETIAGPGLAAVQRSNQTEGYYREIYAACGRSLRELPPKELAQTLGWTVRLTRYHRLVGQGGARSPSGPQPVRPSMPMAEPRAPRPQPLQREPMRPPEPPKPKAPELPAVGNTFTGAVLQIDESAVAIEVPGFDAEKTIGVNKAADLAGRRYREGNTARVEVIGVRTLKSGRTIVELRPAKRE